ncbi:MAG: class I SAM-dependent methyltransferase [Chloroflexaceae bacterium]|nr:class I SAM-dependent methyltransferase [Chloroflexaceae bacterium]
MLKGGIRRTLMLGRRPVPITFRRTLQIDETSSSLTLTDEVRRTDGDTFLRRMAVGDEFFVRYVPQSRYFQSQELEVQGHTLDPIALAAFNMGRRLMLVQVVPDEPGQPPALHTQADDQPISQESAALPFGVYDVDYFEGRKKKPQLIYRLRRRTDEVEEALRRYSNGHLKVVVDVGTADGLMLTNLRQRMGDLTFLGFDLGLALLRANKDGIFKGQADALQMPVASGTADAIIATAIIEHVPDAGAMLQECLRMLRPGGIMVATTPDPTLERISARIGLLKEPGHQETFNLQQLRDLFERAGFEVVQTKKFMFSPVGFPAEKVIERGISAAGLDVVMANQLIVGAQARLSDATEGQLSALCGRTAVCSAALHYRPAAGAGSAWGGGVACWRWPGAERATTVCQGGALDNSRCGARALCMARGLRCWPTSAASSSAC